jgi:4'-phosphopantetheinyl transferase
MLLDKLDQEAHLWVVRPESIESKVILDDCMALLSEHEQKRCRRFRFQQDRHRYLVSHALVRRALSNYADISPEQWEFSASDHGRPKVANPEATAIRFNLSHTSGFMVCLVTLSCDCGVDVESIHLRHNPIGVARKMFSTAEVSQMLRLNGPDQLEYFITRWTLREAYIKARGIGLTFPTHKIDFNITSATEIDIHFQVVTDDKPEAWQFEVFSLADAHIAAAAIYRPEQPDKTIVKYDLLYDMRSYKTHVGQP